MITSTTSPLLGESAVTRTSASRGRGSGSAVSTIVRWGAVGATRSASIEDQNARRQKPDASASNLRRWLRAVTVLRHVFEDPTEIAETDRAVHALRHLRGLHTRRPASAPERIVQLDGRSAVARPRRRACCNVATL